MQALPDPRTRHPIKLPNGEPHLGTVFLKPVITHENWDVGEYTYASDFEPPQDWASRLAPYLYPGAPDRLRIGKFCQIASGARFVTASANHVRDGISAYPFPVFDPAVMRGFTPDLRDTVIGHDVWIGMNAIICPGSRVGNGCFIGAGAVVSGTIPSYSVVTGNPAMVRRRRFAAGEIERLEAMRWWDWPANKIAQAQSVLMAGDVDALERFAERD